MKNGITLRDIYDIMYRLEEKIDNRLEKHEERIAKVENNQNKALGILSILVLVISSGASFLWDLILGRR